MGTQGAIFNLLLRDDRYDKYLTANDVLRDRLSRLKTPTYEDITKSHNLYLYSTYKPYVAIASEYSKVKSSGGSMYLSNAKTSMVFHFNIFGHFTSDMAIQVKFKPIGNPDSNDTDYPLLRYCAWPGIRLFEKVELKSDQVVVDDYVPDDVILWMNHFVGKDKMTGWQRCHGQQETKEATYYNANGFTGVLHYRDGLQTPKRYHEEFDMFVPLHFEMCKDPASAIPNHLTTNTQRTISVDLAKLSDIVQALDDQGNVIPLPFERMAIELNLYINGLYVNPDIHCIFSEKVNFKLMRVHRRQHTILHCPEENIKMDKLKYPAEFLMSGFRSTKNAEGFDTWCLMGGKRERTPEKKLLVPAMIWNTTDDVCELVCRDASETTSLDPVVTDVGVLAHGTTIFEMNRLQFYNSYLPGRYNSCCGIMSPIDSSSFLIPFCLFPGDTKVSGYYNLSTGRELFISYRGKDISSDNPVELVVSMSALNFLLRKGDTMSLLISL